MNSKRRGKKNHTITCLCVKCLIAFYYNWTCFSLFLKKRSISLDHQTEKTHTIFKKASLAFFHLLLNIRSTVNLKDKSRNFCNSTNNVFCCVFSRRSVSSRTDERAALWFTQQPVDGSRAPSRVHSPGVHWVHYDTILSISCCPALPRHRLTVRWLKSNKVD